MSVNVSGITDIGHAAESGTGMQIIQGKTVGDYSIAGALFYEGFSYSASSG